MRRGDLWWADLGAHRPQEQTGRRPVIIWQSDEACTVEVRGERHDEHRLKYAVQRLRERP